MGSPPDRVLLFFQVDELAGPSHAVQFRDVAGRVGGGVHQVSDDGDSLGYLHADRAWPPAQPGVTFAVIGCLHDADGRPCGRGGQQRVIRREIEDLVDVVFDDADLVRAAVPGDLRLPGAVRQGPSRAAQRPRRRHPPGEVLPGIDLGGDRLAAGEPAVGQVQVTGPVGGFQVRGEGGLPGAARPGRPGHRAAGPDIDGLDHPDLRVSGRAGAGLAEVRGVAGLPAAALAVAAPGVGDVADGAVLGQHPQPVPAAVPPRPARERPQPDRRPLPARRPRRRQAHRRDAGQRDGADLPAQPGQQPQERLDLQEAVRVRQRRRRGQVISRVSFPGPLRQQRAASPQPCRASAPAPGSPASPAAA